MYGFDWYYIHQNSLKSYNLWFRSYALCHPSPLHLLISIETVKIEKTSPDYHLRIKINLNHPRHVQNCAVPIKHSLLAASENSEHLGKTLWYIKLVWANSFMGRRQVVLITCRLRSAKYIFFFVKYYPPNGKRTQKAFKMRQRLVCAEILDACVCSFNLSTRWRTFNFSARTHARAVINLAGNTFHPWALCIYVPYRWACERAARRNAN